MLHKESLNSDDQQCHKYQQIEQSTTSYLKPMNTKKTMTYGTENPGPGLGQAQKCGRVKQDKQSHVSSLIV